MHGNTDTDNQHRAAILTADTIVWRVRVMIRGAGTIHAVSSTRPRLDSPGQPLVWTPLDGTPFADTVGFINWAEVAAVSWRPRPLGVIADETYGHWDRATRAVSTDGAR